MQSPFHDQFSAWRARGGPNTPLSERPSARGWKRVQRASRTLHALLQLQEATGARLRLMSRVFRKGHVNRVKRPFIVKSMRCTNLNRIDVLRHISIAVLTVFLPTGSA
ncbi:hypothetical protein BDR04DRAFT_1100397 [Suillus decipiens]|nr:hypothetical protein BDR04DRAFT_1100397 [Suillus decipiens]